MSDIRDRYVIESLEKINDQVILIINDPMKWNYNTRVYHTRMLKEKINDYLQFITSGQIEEHDQSFNKIVIQVIADHSYSQYCLDFLFRCKNYIEDNIPECTLQWIHSRDEDYDDGFIDDFVLDFDKIYPRIKKNWAQHPMQEVSLMAADSNFYCKWKNDWK